MKKVWNEGKWMMLTCIGKCGWGGGEVDDQIGVGFF